MISGTLEDGSIMCRHLPLGQGLDSPGRSGHHLLRMILLSGLNRRTGLSDTCGGHREPHDQRRHLVRAALTEKRGGVIFARDDLTINGGGSLTVSGGYKHGIDANDDIVIAGSGIRISAPRMPSM